jgi:type IV secretion system protein TrbL
MSWLRSSQSIAVAAGLLASLAVLAQPSPPSAQANVACDIGSAPVHAVTGAVGAITGGAIGGGNPVGDACNAVSGEVTGVVTDPIGDALQSVGNGVFEQVTTWVAQGASWLIGQVVVAIEETTTTQLTTQGFLTQYGKMAQIAALMGLAMLLLAVLEGLAQGNAGLLARVVVVNLPLAFIATSVAYAVVQLLLVATDGLCHAIASASGDNSEHFFKTAITGLGEAGGSAGKEVGGSAGGPVGKVAGQAEGATAVPLFVTFLAAIIGAFAAFMVWLELLMRDAAIYVVALFMPLALAASIWPRWMGALRRTGELVVVIIGSKFVIVSIISLAAGLVAENDGRVEHILAAAALMLLACFAPFVLLKLVPFAEGAMGAAYGRRSASGGAMSGVQVASDVQILRNMARSNFGESGATLWNAGGQGGGSPGPEPSAPRGGGPASGSGGGGGAAAGGSSGAGGGASAGGSAGGAAAGGAAAGAGVGAAAAVPAAAMRGTKAAAQRLEGTGVAQQAGSEAGGGAAVPDPKPGSGGQAGQEPAKTGGGGAPGAGAPPSDAAGGKAPRAGEQPPRPAPGPAQAKPEKGAKS